MRLDYDYIDIYGSGLGMRLYKNYRRREGVYMIIRQ